MKKIVRLRELDNGLYELLRSPTFQSGTDSGSMEITPVSYIDFGSDHVLSNPNIVLARHGLGYYLDGSASVPLAMESFSPETVAFESGNYAILKTSSDVLMRSSLEHLLLSNMQGFTGENARRIPQVSEIARAAVQSTFDPPTASDEQIYRELQNQTEGSELLTQLQLPGQLPENSPFPPTDLRGSPLHFGEELYLALSRPSIPDELLTLVLDNIEDFDIISNFKEVDVGASKVGGYLCSAPGVIRNEIRYSEFRASQRLREGPLAQSMRRFLYSRGELENAYILGDENISWYEGAVVGESVEYTRLVKAVQPLRAQEGNVTVSKNLQGNAFEYDGDVRVGSPIRSARSIAAVKTFDFGIHLPSYFATPEQMDSFDGSEFSGRAGDFLDAFFYPGIANAAEDLRTKQGKNVSGVVLSPIDVHSHINDYLVSMGQFPNGRISLAVTFLEG